MGVATFQRAKKRKERGEESPLVSAPYVCPKCGKDCKIKMAFTNHTKVCKG